MDTRLTHWQFDYPYLLKQIPFLSVSEDDSLPDKHQLKDRQEWCVFVARAKCFVVRWGHQGGAALMLFTYVSYVKRPQWLCGGPPGGYTALKRLQKGY